MKTISVPLQWAITAGMALVLVFAGLPVLRTQAAQPAAPTPQATTEASVACGEAKRTVHVSGTAVVNVKPDLATLQLGVQSNGTTPDEVRTVNATAMQKVIKALSDLGIENKDISTDIYVIDPVYENYDSLYIKGYRINNVLEVTIRDVSKTSDVVAAALKAGVNQVIDLQFYTSDLRKYRDQARQLAIQAASEKAKALAGAAGAETGCVQEITENTSTSYNGWWYGRNQNLATQNVMQNVAPASGNSGDMEDPISLGQIAIRAEIDVTYGLK
jgi:uncharacterized protein YggE